MGRLFCIFIFFVCLAGVGFGQDLDYYRSALTSDNVEAKRTILLEIRNLHSEAASRAAIPALSDRKEVVRAAAATAVIYLPPSEAVSVLAPLLNDKAAFVRGEAAFALGEVGDASATRVLIASLEKDSATEVRSAVAIALGKIGDPNAVAALAAALKGKPSSANELLRRSAARSIGEIANAARSASLGDYHLAAAFQDANRVLINVLQNKKETDDTRREAAFTLGAIGDGSSITALRSNLGSPDYYLADICKEALDRLETSH